MEASHSAAKKAKKMSREELDEREHFKNVVDAFGGYKRDSADRIARTREQIKRLPLDQQGGGGWQFNSPKS